MSSDLARSAASMFTVGFLGRDITPELAGLLERGVGGVIFFARNLGTPAEVAALIHEIKRRAGRPLLVTVDQEGGRVARLRQGFTPLPPMRVVGSTFDPTLAYELGQVIGHELRVVGFDLTYSPVLDVDTNPDNPVIGDRSFGRTAELVSQMGVALMKGLASVGVAACGKHFPGHGDTAQDPHLALPRLQRPLEQLERVELRPFEAAAEAGIPAIMSAHVIFEAIDRTLPATLSRPVLHGLLRERLGFRGVIVTDDMEMKAIADHYAVEETVVRGVDAGVDQFLFCHTAEVAHCAMDSLIRAVETGTIAREKIDLAHQRVGDLVTKYAQPPLAAPDLSVLGGAPHRAVVDRIFSAAAAQSAQSELDPTEIMERLRN